MQLSKLLKPDFLGNLGMVIIIALTPLFYGLLLSIHPQRGPHLADLAMYYPWLRWDSFHYLSIAHGGYQAKACGEFVCGNTAWFPLYPLLIRVSSLLIDKHISAFVVAFLSFIFLVYALRHLIEKKWSAPLTAFVLLLLPSGFYLTAAFPVSLVLLLQVLALVSLRSGYLALAWLIYLFAGLSYPSALLFSVGIIPYIRYSRLNSLRYSISSLFLITAPLQGYALSRLIIQLDSGIANAYHRTVMRYGFRPSLDFEVLRSSVRYFPNSPIYFQTFLVFSLLLFCLYFYWRNRSLATRLDLSVILSSLALWLPPHVYGDSISIYRQEALLIPLFVLVGSRLHGRMLLPLIAVLFVNAVMMANLFFDATLV